MALTTESGWRQLRCEGAQCFCVRHLTVSNQLDKHVALYTGLSLRSIHKVLGAVGEIQLAAAVV